MLDDHIDRTLAGVFSSLSSLQALVDILPSHPANIDTNELNQLISDDLSLRSISLVDRHRKVLASSNPENLGKLVPVALMEQVNGESADSALPAPQLYPAQPFRDLADLAARTISKTQQMMMASLPIKKNGETYLGLAVINISLFENLWERIGHSHDVEIALIDYRGETLLSKYPQVFERQALISEILTRVETRQIGHFYFGTHDQNLVVYRAASQHSKIFVTITNRVAASAPLIEEKQELLQWGVGLTGLFSIFFWVVYIWYRRYEKAVTYSNNLLRGITAHVMMTRSALDGSIIEANEPFLKVTGYSLEEVIGKNHRMFNSGMQSQEFYKVLWETISNGDIWKGTFRNKTKKGDLIWVNATIIPNRDQWGTVLHYIALFSDITKAIEISERFERERKHRESLERMNKELRTDLNLDHLTQIANRRGLDQFLEQLSLQAEATEAPLAVLMLDIDHFKVVNDSWGHHIGDEVLKELAQRWLSQLRSSDMFARLGGEEFVVVLSRTDLKSAEFVAEKIRAATEKSPITVLQEGQTLNIPVTVSIGVTAVDQFKDADVKRLLKVADEALYAAKRAGRNCIRSDHSA